MIHNAKAATFTRPANTTQYTSGDLVANHATAGSVVPLEFKIGPAGGGGVKIKRFRLVKSDAGVTTAAFRLHLFGASPVVANGDNGAFTATQTSTYIGSLDITAMTGGTGGAFAAGAPVAGDEILAQLTSDTVYGLLEARGTYTPASEETFTVTLETER